MLGLYSTVMGIIKLSLGVKVLQGPKNDQSLCNTIMVVFKFKDRVDGIRFVLSSRYCIAKMC